MSESSTANLEKRDCVGWLASRPSSSNTSPEPAAAGDSNRLPKSLQAQHANAQSCNKIWMSPCSQAAEEECQGSSGSQAAELAYRQIKLHMCNANMTSNLETGRLSGKKIVQTAKRMYVSDAGKQHCHYAMPCMTSRRQEVFCLLEMRPPSDNTEQKTKNAASVAHTGLGRRLPEVRGMQTAIGLLVQGMGLQQSALGQW